MATTPVFVKAPSGLAGLVLKLAAEPIVGTLDPALVNGAGGDTLTELTNVLGWYSADVTEALAGSYVGTVETSGGTPISAGRFDLADTTTPVFEALDANAVSSSVIASAAISSASFASEAEPAQGTPPATATLAQKIGYLYKAWRNKSTQTATTYSLFNDDAATVDHKSTVSDDNVTATKTEVVTGP